MKHFTEDYIAYNKAMDGSRRRRGRALLSLSRALGFFLVLFSSGLEAQNVTSVPKMGEAVERRMFVDPSSTTVSHNKVRLIVAPLTHQGKFYVGSYRLKVFPYFFKSETGTLKLEAPDEGFRKFTEGTEVKFAGKATNNKGAKDKIITGKAKPSDEDKGSLIFSLETDNGRMTFKTSYHFAK
jgi:hypothetical protein